MTRWRSGLVGAVAAVLLLPQTTRAEYAVYGEVELAGLARENWQYSTVALLDAMVCNVNGPDGFLTVRSGPDSSYAKVRAFNRLAILTVDIREQYGSWVRIVDGYRTVTQNGISQPVKELPVYGWAHTGYLCDFYH
ncbi:SH3 domain-containing protein [Sulfitobacter sp. JB4-11]|uniref:SH3 domain-containing protein n=1 Tax=Sulfitobacter rhodophyticola TaxID=3238304 RepID=UPI003513ACC2